MRLEGLGKLKKKQKTPHLRYTVKTELNHVNGVSFGKTQEITG
jgi:hypothetical protein